VERESFTKTGKFISMPKAFGHDLIRARSNPRPARAAVWAQLACALIAAPAIARAAAFGFDDVALQAQTLAQLPYRKPPAIDARRAGLDYDQARRIRFVEKNALWRGTGSPFEVHFFPVLRTNTRSLRLHEISAGQARELQLPASIFDNDGVLPPEAPAAPAMVAGWKLTFPLNDAAKRDEVAAFLGSNYFRAIGQGQRYGLSARALGIDTVGGTSGEEFPDFTAYWFETPQPGATEFVFHALLDSPRATGAYRFALRPGTDTAVDVRAKLFFRAAGTPIASLGVAPLTSMFLHGENQPSPSDFRPEVHDSDGLQIETAEGEWIWRPLTHPNSTFVTSFTLNSPRGFGLMQRDRQFANYEDPEVRYELRPSAWIEPLGAWGAGRVELLQFRTPDETHDNIAAYWVPAAPPQPGVPMELSWRVHWQGAAPRLPPNSHVTQSRTGYGYSKTPPPKQRRKFLLDFAGPALPQGPAAMLADAAAAESAANPGNIVQAVASTSVNARIVRVNAYPNPARKGWRATVEFDRLDPKQAVELRVFLRQGANTLSETWSYALAPD
jgi:periplasmic glucans biosynthesis protein